MDRRIGWWVAGGVLIWIGTALLAYALARLAGAL